jgi:hypothetical protein
VIQSDLVLRGLEGLLDRPADPGNPGELTQRGVARGGGEVVGQVSGVGQAASGEQPVLGLAAPGGQGPDPGARPPVGPRAFRARMIISLVRKRC